MSGSVEVEIGEEVQTGTLQGKEGSRGRSSQSRLDFELQNPQEEAFAAYAGEFSQEQR